MQVGATGLGLQGDEFFKKELSSQVSCGYGPAHYDPTHEERPHDQPGWLTPDGTANSCCCASDHTPRSKTSQNCCTRESLLNWASKSRRDLTPISRSLSRPEE